jgi:photosystem II stability/assembly factor-like uncharacterized protein
MDRAQHPVKLAVVKRAGLYVLAAVVVVALAAPAPALGATWSAQRSGTTLGLNDVDFVDTLHGWAVGNMGTILATSDGGVTWVQQPRLTLKILTAVDFVDTLHGWAVGQEGVILATGDGGATWTQQTFPVAAINRSPLPLSDVSFLDTMNGWAVGLTGVCIYTTNGGATWTRDTLPYGPDIDVTTDFAAIRMADATHGWMIGEDQIAYTPSGIVDNPPFWHLSLGPMVFLRAIDSISTTQAWVVGDSGQIFVTHDGLTWTPQASGTAQELRDVSALDALNIWALSSQGTVLTSLDGGATWQSKSIALPYSFTAMSMVDATHGWIVGGRGTIWAYGDTGALPVPNALRNAKVRRGNTANLRYRVDYPAGICRVTIKVMRKGKTVKTFIVKDAKVNKNLVKSFTCKLKKGVYTWSVSAMDAAGNQSTKTPSKKLFVR